jgi:hypothetical protein
MTGTVCLDFDDTLRGHRGKPMPGVPAALASLRADGVALVVSSARFSPIYGELNRFRIQKVADWLSEHGIEVDAIRLFVPEADVYVDDRAYRFEKDWPTEASRIMKRLSPGWKQGRTLDKKLSLALDTLWDGAAPVTEAVGAVDELRRHGVQVIVSAGPFLDLEAEADPAPPTRALRDRLQAAGLKVTRVDAEKISSDLYVNRRGLHYEGGDWSETLRAIRGLLSR